jgi:flagellar FliL protein
MAKNNLDASPEDAAGAEAQQPPGKKKRILPPVAIYLLIAVVMMVVGYFAGTKFLGSASGTGHKGEKAAEEKTDEKGAPKENFEMVMVDDIIVNPAGTGGTRFLSTSVGFEISSKEAGELFEQRRPMIRDALIMILGSKTIEELSDPKEKEITRFQIKKRVEQLLETDNLEAVYFTDFVLQ